MTRIIESPAAARDRRSASAAIKELADELAQYAATLAADGRDEEDYAAAWHGFVASVRIEAKRLDEVVAITAALAERS